MRDKPKDAKSKVRPREAIPRKKPKPLADMVSKKPSLAGDVAGPSGYDKEKTQRTTRRATQAADRLLREMDEFLKQTRKLE